MTREEEIKNLREICQILESMTDEERFDYFMENSPLFNKDMTKLMALHNTASNTSPINTASEVRIEENQKSYTAVALKEKTDSDFNMKKSVPNENKGDFVCQIAA